MNRISLRRSLLLSAGALAIAALVGAVPVDHASAQGTQGYTTNNGGSSTTNGSGTRGGTNVDGSGPGGPRDPARLNNANPNATNNNPNLATGRNGNSTKSTSPYATDSNDPNQNPRGLRSR